MWPASPKSRRPRDLKQSRTRVGEHFLLSTTTLRAVDASGRFLPKTPIAVQLYYSPGVVEFTAEDHRELVGSQPGRAVAIFDAMCGIGTERARLEVPITVVP